MNDIILWINVINDNRVLHPEHNREEFFHPFVEDVVGGVLVAKFQQMREKEVLSHDILILQGQGGCGRVHNHNHAALPLRCMELCILSLVSKQTPELSAYNHSVIKSNKATNLMPIFLPFIIASKVA
jgi:hypothetical protein